MVFIYVYSTRSLDPNLTRKRRDTAQQNSTAKHMRAQCRACMRATITARARALFNPVQCHARHSAYTHTAHTRVHTDKIKSQSVYILYAKGGCDVSGRRRGSVVNVLLIARANCAYRILCTIRSIEMANKLFKLSYSPTQPNNNPPAPPKTWSLYLSLSYLK